MPIRSSAPDVRQHLADLFGSERVVMVSRCFDGVPCRYHGRSVTRYGKPCGRPSMMKKLRDTFDRVILICPEVDAGLPTPRPPIFREGGRLICNEQDITERLERQTRKIVEEALRLGVTEAYLMKDSPTCDPSTGISGMALAAAGVRAKAI